MITTAVDWFQKTDFWDAVGRVLIVDFPGLAAGNAVHGDVESYGWDKDYRDVDRAGVYQSAYEG